MSTQIGYFDSLKSVAGKVFNYLASITLTGTDGKTITCTQDAALDDTVSLSKKANLETANSFTNIAPMTTLAESWIGPSVDTGIYFYGGNIGIGGTSTPQRRLHIYTASDDVAGIVRFGGNTSYYMDVGYQVSTGVGIVSAFGGTASDLYARLALQPNGGNVGIGTTTVPSKLTVAGLINMKNYTVATLPGGTQGDICYVTDALAPAFLTIIVGGGTVKSPVFFNGTNWVGF